MATTATVQMSPEDALEILRDHAPKLDGFTVKTSRVDVSTRTTGHDVSERDEQVFSGVTFTYEKAYVGQR